MFRALSVDDIRLHDHDIRSFDRRIFPSFESDTPPCRLVAALPARGRTPLRRSPLSRGVPRIRNPNGSVVFEMKDVLVPEAWSQVAVDILAQKYFRRAGVPAQLDHVAEAGVPEWLQRQRARAGRRPHRRRDRRAAGVPPAGRLLDLLGLEGRLLLVGGRRPRLLRRDLLHARRADGRARTARSGSTPACTGPTASKGRRRGTTTSIPQTGEIDALDVRLRAARAARLLHPVDQRRPGQRRRHHGPVGPRGAHLQVRLGHGLATSPPSAARASRSPAAASRAG